MHIQTISLETLTAQIDLKDGVARALEQVLANIQDLRTQPERTRKLLIQIDFTPSVEDRHEVSVEVQVATKLAAVLALHVQAKLAKEGQKAVLRTMDFAQQALFREAAQA